MNTVKDIYIRRGAMPPRRSGRRPVLLVLLGILAVVALVWGGLARRARRARPAPDETPPAADVERADPARAPEEPVPDEPPEAEADPATIAAVRTRLEEARARLADGDPVAARARAFAALARAPDRATRRAAEDLLGEIHTRLVFNPYPMEEKVEYVVQRGDSLERIGRQHGIGIEQVDLLRRGNGIRGDTIHPGQRLRILQGTFRVEISRTRNELTVYLNDRFFKRYRVGTGRFDQTPVGRFRVTGRLPHPVWYRPDGRVIPYGDPENELGTHWISLDIPRYGIHGTWEPETIGQRASAGCVRLLNEDVEELFLLLPTGTEVVIAD